MQRITTIEMDIKNSLTAEISAKGGRLWETDKTLGQEKPMTDHWLDDMLPRNHGPDDMPQKYPPYTPFPGVIMSKSTEQDILGEKFKQGGIQVYSGGAAWPLDMDKTEIDIRDIAHALSMKVRYTGHCIEQYSIAQHCCHVHDLVPFGDRLEALLHDASEYVLPDVAAPLKKEPEIRQWFKPIEEAVEIAIARTFGLRCPFPPSIKAADNAIALFERTKIMVPPKHAWMVWTVPGEPAYIPNFEVWSWKKSKFEFLQRARALGIE